MERRNPDDSIRLFEGARAIARDHDSGASEMTARALSLLEDAVRVGGSLPLDVARIVLAGQPAMAPLWHACGAAVFDSVSPGAFDRRRRQMERAPRALVRAASFALRDLLAGEPSPCIATVSYSSSVSRLLRDLASSMTLRAVCAEGRPRYEGRRLAVELADAGIAVTLVTDAALTTLLDRTTAIVVGADAVSSEWWMNKAGSFGVSAAAAHRGVPVYVVVTRDKFVPDTLRHRVKPALADPAQVWPERPAGVAAENAYFEHIPVELATLFLTDGGPLSPADLRQAIAWDADHLSYLLAALG